MEISDKDSRVKHYAPYVKDESKREPYRPMGEVVEHPELYKRYPKLKELPTRVMTGSPTEQGYYVYRGGPRRLEAQAPGKDRAGYTLTHERQHAVQARETELDPQSTISHGGDPSTAPANYSSPMARELQAEEIAELGEMIKTGKDGDYVLTPDNMKEAKAVHEELKQLHKHGLVNVHSAAYARYRTVIGEQMAHAAGQRRHLTAEQQRARYPGLDFDVPPEHQSYSGPHTWGQPMATGFEQQRTGSPAKMLPELYSQTQDRIIPRPSGTKTFKRTREELIKDLVERFGITPEQAEKYLID